MSLEFTDGRSVRAPMDHGVFEATSAIASSTFHPAAWKLVLQTVRGDEVVVVVPEPCDFAPLGGRSTIYLDQNHWSTLTHAIHEPTRIRNEGELRAAEQLIELSGSGKVILPMSSAHMSETVQQVDHEPRYRRALTIAQLAGGWQLRDPLELRRFELKQAMTIRYRGRCLLRPAPVTLEPNALHSARIGEFDTSSFAGLPTSAVGQLRRQCYRWTHRRHT